MKYKCNNNNDNNKAQVKDLIFKIISSFKKNYN